MGDIFVPQICETKMIKNNRLETKHSSDSSAELFRILCMSQPGDRVVIHGPMGAGKTYSTFKCAYEWQSGHPQLKHYDFVYYIPVKETRRRCDVITSIICKDLKIVPQYLSTCVSINLKEKFNFNLVIIDGFDELSQSEQRDSIFTKLLSGAVAKTAVVVVTTRSECLPTIQHHTRGNYLDLYLRPLSQPGLYSYIDQVFPEEPQSFRLVSRTLMSMANPLFTMDTVSTPFILSIICYLCKMSLNKKPDVIFLQGFNTIHSLISAFFSHVIHMKITGNNNLKSSLPERLVENENYSEIADLFYSVGRISFECLEREEMFFTEDLLRDTFTKTQKTAETFKQLGLLEGIQGGARFHHNIFQDYLAAMHIARDMSALKRLFTMYNRRHEEHSIFHRFRDVFVFAIGIRPDILKEIPMGTFKTPLLISVKIDAEFRIDLSLESELIMECKHASTAKRFLSQILDSPFKPVKIVDFLPMVNLTAYANLLNLMKYSDCLRLVYRALNGEESCVPQNREEEEVCAGVADERHIPSLNPPKGSPYQMIGDPIILTVLPSLNLGSTRKLSIRNITPSTFNNIIQDLVNRL